MRQVKVVGTYLEPDGDPVEMRLSFTPTSVLKNVSENIVILEKPIEVMTNARGYFEVLLYPWQEGMLPTEFLYEVRELKGSNLVNVWHLRLDEDTPDEVNFTTVYPAGASVSNEIYPTLAEVRSIAADLDSAIYVEMGAVDDKVDAQTATLNTKLGTEALGTTVPTMADGKILNQFIPTLYIASSFGAHDQTEMLARYDLPLGTICRRIDEGRSYILEGEDSTVISNWVLLSDNFSVTSVNGQAGMVILTANDVDAAPAVHGHEVLSGHEYSATFMKSSVQTTAREEVTQGAEQIVITPKRISWLDSSKTEFFYLDPYTSLTWTPLALNPLNAAGTAVTGVSFTASTRTIITGLTQLSIDFPLGQIVEFGFPNVDTVLPRFMGNWVVTNDLGEPVPYANHLAPSHGAFSGTGDYRIVFGGLREFLTWRATVYPGVQHYLHARGNLA